MNSKNQTTWINLSLERPLISCLSKRSYNPSLKSLPPADFFREVTHVKHFLFQSSRWSTEQNTKDDFGSIFQHRLIYHIACRDVLSNQNLLDSTCNINNNLQREETLLLRGREKGKSRKSYQRTERTTIRDTVEQWRSRKNRPCRTRWTPVSGSKYKIYFKSFFMIEQFNKERH